MVGCTVYIYMIKDIYDEVVTESEVKLTRNVVIAFHTLTCAFEATKHKLCFELKKVTYYES